MGDEAIRTQTAFSSSWPEEPVGTLLLYPDRPSHGVPAGLAAGAAGGSVHDGGDVVTAS